MIRMSPICFFPLRISFNNDVDMAWQQVSTILGLDDEDESEQGG